VSFRIRGGQGESHASKTRLTVRPRKHYFLAPFRSKVAYTCNDRKPMDRPHHATALIALLVDVGRQQVLWRPARELKKED